MLQRLGLAQALMHRPRLLVLDEPTDGVDPVGRRHIRDILNGLTGTGVTVFINSHLLGEVESFCDYVAILHKGTLALEGKISSLIAGRGYLVTASGLPDGLSSSIRSMGAAIAFAGNAVEVQVATREQANRLIDEIRAAGALIESVTASTSSLEDVFMRATEVTKAA